MADPNNSCSTEGCNGPMTGVAYDPPFSEETIIFQFCELHEKPIATGWRKLTDKEALIFEVMEY